MFFRSGRCDQGRCQVGERKRKQITCSDWLQPDLPSLDNIQRLQEEQCNSRVCGLVCLRSSSVAGHICWCVWQDAGQRLRHDEQLGRGKLWMLHQEPSLQKVRDQPWAWVRISMPRRCDLQLNIWREVNNHAHVSFVSLSWEALIYDAMLVVWIVKSWIIYRRICCRHRHHRHHRSSYLVPKLAAGGGAHGHQ